jgi:hypothetical protein
MESFKFNKDNFNNNENNGLFDGVDLDKSDKNYFSNLIKSLYRYTLMKH